MLAQLKKISPVVVVGLMLTVACLTLFVFKFTFITTLTNYTYDNFLRRVAKDPQSDAVVIVDLDDKSLSEEKLGQWPWPRYLNAKLTDQIFKAGASVVAYDVVFAERDRTSPEVLEKNMNDNLSNGEGITISIKGLSDEQLDFDQMFADSLAKGQSILGSEMMPVEYLQKDVDTSIDPFYKQYYHPRQTGGSGANINTFLMQAEGISLAIPKLNKVTSTAFFNAVPDPDNIVRSNPLVCSLGDNRRYPALALEAVRLHLGIPQGLIKFDQYGVVKIVLRDLEIDTDRSGRLVVNYRKAKMKEGTRGFFSTFPCYSAVDVINGNIPDGALSNKIVFVGTSAIGLKDMRATPVTAEFSGVEIHATMVDNMLARDALYNPNWMDGVYAIIIAFVGVFLTIFISKGKSWLSFIVSMLMIGVAIMLSLLMLERYNLVFVPAWVVLSILIIYPVLTMIKYWQEELQKKQVRNMFGTMVSETVLQYLEDNPGSFQLNGQSAEATMFFSDVAGFTTISESLKPDQLSKLLNHYLSPMTDIIMERDGYVDKYEGDLIMAEWGVPYANKEHEIQGCLSAVEQQIKLAEIRPILKKEFGHEIHVRMGLNSGTVAAGNMGSSKKMQYTVMGDAVNQAARFEPINNDYGTLIIIGESTYLGAKEHIEARLLDKIVVKGKTKPINIYELMAKKGELKTQKVEVAKVYEEALRLHWERKWDESIKLLNKALGLDQNDGPSVNMLKRVQKYKENEPAAEWVGEYVKATK